MTNALSPLATAAILAAPIVLAVAVAFWPSREQLARRRWRRARRRAALTTAQPRLPRQRTHEESR